MMFGEHIKKRRLDMGMSLRAFCMEYSEDPSNWSKMERGVNPPPKSYERLLQIAQHLGYEENGKGMEGFFDLAHISHGSIPPDISEDAVLMEKLPLLFRTLRGKTTDGELMQLVDLVREAHTPDA